MLNSIASFHGKPGYRYRPFTHVRGVVAESVTGLVNQDAFYKGFHACEYHFCAHLSLIDC